MITSILKRLAFHVAGEHRYELLHRPEHNPQYLVQHLINGQPVAEWKHATSTAARSEFEDRVEEHHS